MVRIDAQGQQQGIVRDLHHEGRGESIAQIPMSDAHHINARRQALKQTYNRIAHPRLPVSGSSAPVSAINKLLSHIMPGLDQAIQTLVFGASIARSSPAMIS